jgi:Flp pilus assembly protein TadD
VDAYVGLAETFKREEKYALAEQTLIRARELEPANWAASMVMGRYLFNVGRVEEAVHYLTVVQLVMA